MALRTWSRVLLTALGVAAAAGAGQLGFAYGLGIVRFSRSFLQGAEQHWPGQLAWVGWFAMVAAVAGALAAERMARRHRVVLGLAGRAGSAAVAALGALSVAPLTMQPARAAEITPGVDPVLTVGLTALLGAVAGGVVAGAVLVVHPVRWNVVVVTGAVWALALASVAPSLGPRDALPTVRLGVLDLPSLSAGATRALALVGIPALALLAGAATAGLARWLGSHQLAPMAASGAAGPAMLALAYVLGGPGSGSQQAAPYWASLIGLAAGLLGSVLLAVVPAPGATRPEPAASGTPAPSGAPAASGTPAPSGAPAASGTPAPSGVAWPGAAGRRGARRGAGRDDPAAAPRDEPAVEPPRAAADRQDPSGDEAAGSRDVAALTDPTPDPLTAPLEQVRAGRRPRPRRTGTSAAGAAPAEPLAARPPVPEPPATAARRKAAEPAQPVVPEPALKEVPTEALPPTAGPRPRRPARPSWLSMRRERPAATGAAEAAAPETKSSEAAAPREAAPPAVPAAPEQPRPPRFGRLRRGERTAPEPRPPVAPEKLSAGDEEYVDWVSGLGGNRKRDRS